METLIDTGKHLEVPYDVYINIRARIVDLYGNAVGMISYKMREVCGFSLREHHSYDKHNNWNIAYCVDFFDASARSMFVLQFSDILNFNTKEIVE